MQPKPHYIGDEDPANEELVLAEPVPNDTMFITDDPIVISDESQLVISDDSSHREANSQEIVINDEPCVEICDESTHAEHDSKPSTPITSFDRTLGTAGTFIGLAGGAIGGLLAFASNGLYGPDWTGMMVATAISFGSGIVASWMTFNLFSKWRSNRRGNTPVECENYPVSIGESVSLAKSSLTDWSVSLLFVLFLVVAVGIAWTSTKLLSPLLAAALIGLAIPSLAWGLGVSLVELPETPKSESSVSID